MIKLSDPVHLGTVPSGSRVATIANFIGVAVAPPNAPPYLLRADGRKQLLSARDAEALFAQAIEVKET